jgi:hypothetical protein
MIKIGSRMGKYKESDDLGDRVEANIVKKEVTLYLVVLRRRIIFIPSINNFINIYQ